MHQMRQLTNYTRIGMYMGFIEYVLTNSVWWFGFSVGALLFFKIGIEMQKRVTQE